MNELMNAQVFFFISSIGFIILGILLGIFLFYLIRATKTFDRIMGKLEDDIDKIGDTTKEMLEDMHESAVFRFLFKKKKRKSKN